MRADGDVPNLRSITVEPSRSGEEAHITVEVTVAYEEERDLNSVQVCRMDHLEERKRGRAAGGVGIYVRP